MFLAVFDLKLFWVLVFLSSRPISKMRFFSQNFFFQVNMASIFAKLPPPPPPLFVSKRQPLLGNLGKFLVSAIGESQGRVAVVAKATGESPESSTSLSIVKSVQNIWDKSEDRFALIGLGFAAVVALWASANLITVTATALWASPPYLLMFP
ncbi:unnamed protein product [Ilex paraguariensis]|uniref:Cyanobacterial aminoacyl-tRNA synthetase CAAD domain-containing protein n=1 Tax=Ilex paraguariensis TaxID=185542 RepID=A0ABC8TYK8_9AQUA